MSHARARRSAPGRGLKGAVDFRGVRFGYREGTDVLSGFDLHIPAGQTVALLGATGAGKSTVARLLARFYDPLEGEVVRRRRSRSPALDEAALHDAVAMVTQESFLFSGTWPRTSRFGRPAPAEAEIVAAARAVGVDSFVAALGNGYESDVGKQGSHLSAGQRQLVALARAFLADPAVLILDEASSSLDAPDGAARPVRTQDRSCGPDGASSSPTGSRLWRLPIESSCSSPGESWRTVLRSCCSPGARAITPPFTRPGARASFDTWPQVDDALVGSGAG